MLLGQIFHSAVSNPDNKNDITVSTIKRALLEVTIQLLGLDM